MNDINMAEVFKWVKALNSRRKISWAAIGQPIKYSDVGVKKGVLKETLSLDQLETIAKGLGFYEEYSKLFLTGKDLRKEIEDVRFEELVAKKAFEMLLPVLESYNDNVLKAVMNLHTTINDIKINQEEILEAQKHCNQVQEKAGLILEKIEKNF